MRRWLAGLIASALLLVAPLAHAQGWGWTPGTAPVPLPPSVIAVRNGTALQPLVDALPASGGVLQLDPGRFYATLADTTQALTLSKPVTIIGQSASGTYIASPVLIQTGDCHLERLFVSPSGAAYGIKIYALGSGPARCTIRDCIVGAVDTTARNAGQGPAIGIYLDGAILTNIDHTTVGSCTGSGIYVNTSQPVWSTNENIFSNCTSNLNGRYGAEVIGGGIQGFQWIGGNMEENRFGAVLSQSATNITFRGADFESNTFPIATLLDIQTSSPATIEDCNFNCTLVTRAFGFSTCTQATVVRNNFTTFAAYSSCGAFDDRSAGCTERDNRFNNGGFIENRATWTVATNKAFQPNLGGFYGVLWGPSAAGTLGTFGSAWTATGSVTQPTPTTSHLSGWLRRTTFTGSSAAETGIKQTGASDFQFWGGDSTGHGGFYFSCTFRLDAWPANTARLFVGLVASGSTAPASVADSSSLTGDAIGLYHDATDVNVFRFVAVKAGAVSKLALTNGANPPQLDNGQGYRFEMYSYPTSGNPTVFAKLTTLNSNTSAALGTTFTNVFSKTALFAPQVEVGSAAGTYSLGIANVLVQVAR